MTLKAKFKCDGIGCRNEHNLRINEPYADDSLPDTWFFDEIEDLHYCQSCKNKPDNLTALNRLLLWFTPRYEIREEQMGGKTYWMIYFRFAFISYFYERWNNVFSAKFRLKELR
jgi:hypothetical protein